MSYVSHGRAVVDLVDTVQPFCFGEESQRFSSIVFAKSDCTNLRRNQFKAFQLLADEYLALDKANLAAAQSVGAIIEVKCHE